MPKSAKRKAELHKNYNIPGHVYRHILEGTFFLESSCAPKKMGEILNQTARFHELRITNHDLHHFRCRNPQQMQTVRQHLFGRRD
jgi:hypothetical protein